MAIEILHRFLERLIPDKNFQSINTLIIGTFNPGLPEKAKLNAEEASQFRAIEQTKKFINFCQVKNFYDRPQNRFWKIMDVYNDQEFYKSNNYTLRNPNGLKFYQGMNRELVFGRQDLFCYSKGIFVTDLVRSIYPANFSDIYDNFPDTAIERASPEWNTSFIIDIIIKFDPRRVIFNFSSNSSATPKICSEAQKIVAQAGSRVVSAKSTSGAAGFSVDELVRNWFPILDCSK